MKNNTAFASKYVKSLGNKFDKVIDFCLFRFDFNARTPVISEVKNKAGNVLVKIYGVQKGDEDAQAYFYDIHGNEARNPNAKVFLGTNEIVKPECKIKESETKKDINNDVPMFKQLYTIRYNIKTNRYKQEPAGKNLGKYTIDLGCHVFEIYESKISKKKSLIRRHPLSGKEYNIYDMVDGNIHLRRTHVLNGRVFLRFDLSNVSRKNRAPVIIESDGKSIIRAENGNSFFVYPSTSIICEYKLKHKNTQYARNNVEKIYSISYQKTR